MDSNVLQTVDKTAVELNDSSTQNTNQTDISDSTSNSSSNDTEPSQSSVSKLSAKNIKSVYGKKITFSVKILDNKNNVLKNKKVNFVVGGKKYSVTSDSMGLASISLKLNAGKYTIRYSSEGVSGIKTIKVRNYYKLTVYKWHSGANVLKNKVIKNRVPNSNLVKKVVSATKKGTPLIEFKGGNGRVVFITAGVHGNELSSQVAALNLIKYLSTHPIKGTVYVMPFMNPKATVKCVRGINNVDLNRKSNLKGTISYKTVNLITKFKCSAYGDFHCSQPGGVPGKNTVMGTYKPTPKSAVLAKYISKESRVSCTMYNKAGTVYKGTMEDTVTLKGIPAVTCEVKTPHGTIAKGTVEKSLLMMKSFLKFSALI